MNPLLDMLYIEFAFRTWRRYTDRFLNLQEFILDHENQADYSITELTTDSEDEFYVPPEKGNNLIIVLREKDLLKKKKVCGSLKSSSQTDEKDENN